MKVRPSPSELLEEFARLMQLKGENPFKTRAFEKAAALLAGVPEAELKQRARDGTLTDLDGVGKGISEVLTEFLLQGRSTALVELQASIPQGMLELTRIPGLGPKKAQQLIEELGIESVRELEYACRENRLLKLKGFGEKLQQKILDAIAFLHSTEGQARLDEVLPGAEALADRVRRATGARVELTGEIRRRCEVVHAVELLVELSGKSAPKDSLQKRTDLERIIADASAKEPIPVEVKTNFADPQRWGYDWARTTAGEGHWKALGAPEAPGDSRTSVDEESFYRELGLPWVDPVLRETGEEVSRLREPGAGAFLEGLVTERSIQGVFHCHTTRSDGADSLEAMVEAAIARGYRYIGISDHSQTAFYAQGLKAAALKEQEREIRELQEKVDREHPGFRIFWGIESDILKDGSLDYPDSVLKRFDFVIASIHQRHELDRHTMTERIVQAIRNPRTRFIGHLTGRLLLGRRPYEIDIERIIAEAARHDVAIELNSHPQRLDIDWRWGPELRGRKALISINPDAHEVSGLDDTRYGVWMARKALMPAAQVVNTRPVEEVARWLARK
jgi:DNA polymerase (family 10)